MADAISVETIGKLREAFVAMSATQIFVDIVSPRDAVFARYQPVFSPSHIPSLDEEEMRSFLLLDNNHHWSGLHRQGSRICNDMAKLRQTLAILVDELQPVATRLNIATEMVFGMGKNIATAILLITQPERYGVWNNRSELVMKRLGIWPEFERGESFGDRYIKVNDILLQAREAIGTDLWTLDALWWYFDQPTMPPVELPASTPRVPASEASFGLERHLHEFLRDNWHCTELGKEWIIYQEPGDAEAGYEYPCAVGRIDLLAKHLTKPWWLVIELKRDQTSDQTVGQLLRYMGWVRKHLVAPGDEVHGMIVCRRPDDALRYALSSLQNVELRIYQVEFHLKNANDQM